MHSTVYKFKYIYVPFKCEIKLQKKQSNICCYSFGSKIALYILLFAENKHIQDVKEEMEDFAIGEPPEGHGGQSPGSNEAIKRTSAEMDPNANQSTSNKRARLYAEVTKSD